MVTPPLERFFRFVQVTETCWLWTGKTVGTKSTYGHFAPGTRSTDPRVYAHRYAYEQMVGPIPDGHQIDHACGVPLCVNPDHLEPVTPAENMRRARQAVCKNGHDLTAEENQRWDEKGRRRGCIVCHRAKALARYYRKKGDQVGVRLQ